MVKIFKDHNGDTTHHMFVDPDEIVRMEINGDSFWLRTNIVIDDIDDINI